MMIPVRNYIGDNIYRFRFNGKGNNNEVMTKKVIKRYNILLAFFITTLSCNKPNEFKLKKIFSGIYDENSSIAFFKGKIAVLENVSNQSSKEFFYDEVNVG